MKKFLVVLLVLLVSMCLFADKEKIRVEKKVNDLDPLATNHAGLVPPTDDLFDLQFDWPVGIAGGEAGIETDGSYLYTTKWNGTVFYKYELDGTYIGEFSVTGCPGEIRDLAYDGQYFYGAAASNTVYEMDFDTQTTISTINAPIAVRAIAYDADSDGFWGNNWSDQITLFDRNGSTLDSFPCGTFSSYYGFAWDGYSQDGPYLWGYAQDGNTSNQLVQFDITTGLETGVNFDVGTVAAVSTGIAGGLCISDAFVPGYWTICGTAQNINIWGLELCLAADPASPGPATNVTFVPDGAGALEVDIDWTCPTVQVNGDPLTDLDEMRVYRGEDLIYTDTNPTIGAAGSYTDVGVTAAGQYTYKVVGYNDLGEGSPVSESIWVGEDVPDAITNLTLTDVSTGGDLIAQLEWTNPTTGFHGGYFVGCTGYEVERSDGVTFTLNGSMTTWQDDSIIDPGVYYYIVVPVNGSGSGPSTESAQVGIGVSIIQVGNAGASDYQIPMNIYYDNSIVEVVYDQGWLGTDMLINTIGLHSNIVSTVPAFNLEIWLGEVDINDLSGGWLDNSQLTMVYDGTIDVPVGDEWVELTLDTPFEYTYTHNLVMGLVKDDDEYYSSSDVWWTTESGTANRTLHQYNDTEEYSIQAPPTSSNAKTTYPDARFYYSAPTHGSVSGIITDSATSNPIVGAEVYVGNWGPVTTNASGEYLIEEILPGLQPVTATKDGYYDFSGEVTVIADQVVTYDIAMDPFVYATLSGTVTDIDSGSPIEGAEVTINSVLGYSFSATTIADGTYSITDIISDTYDITCEAAGYIPETVQGIVFSTGASIVQDFALQISIYYFSDFEDNDGYLESNNASGWAWGTPTAGPGAAYSGSNLWGTVLGGNYASSANWTLDTTIPVGIISTAYMLEFWHWYDIESSYDGGNVKVSTDGGTTWELITPNGGYPGTGNTSNPLNGEPIYDNTVAGNFWQLAEFDLAAYAGENILVRWHFGSDGSVEYPGWYIDDVRIYEQVYGSLDGHVTEFGTGNSIEGAEVIIGQYSGTSGADGYYFIDGIVTGTYDVECIASNYLPALVEDVVIGEATTTQDINMVWSELAVDVTELNSYLPPDDTETQTFTITNNGPGDLEYSIGFDFPAEIRVKERPARRQATTTSRNTTAPVVTKKSENTARNSFNENELDPNASNHSGLVPPTDDLFDLQFDWTVGVAGGEAGIETDGNYLYTTKWNGTVFYKYELDGTYIGEFSVTGCPGEIRDLAYDGQYFYGAAASNTVYEMDFDAQTTISTINAPIAVRAIAYDAESDGFWGNNWSDQITLFDRNGSTLDSFPCGTFSSYYGFAWDGYSDGGPYLWGYAQDGATSNQLVQFEIATGTETGVNFDVGSVAAVSTGIAGGLCISDAFVSGLYTICGTAQNIDIWGLELCDAVSWVMCTNNSSGTVSANGGTVEVEVTFDSAELVIGDELFADLLIHNNSNYGDDYVIPVALYVTGFIPPVNLYVDPETWLFTWDEPPGATGVLGYQIFLDDMTTQIGTTTNTQWQFEGLNSSQSYIAGVCAVYDDGQSEIQEYEFTTTDAGNGLPLVTELQGNYPNPFNPETQIAFSLNKTAHVKIEIYNVKGQLVKRLLDEERAPDNYTVIWNGRDANNRSVSSGVYFYKMKAGDYLSTRKMILMK
jgi:hypothetical protein